VSTYTVKQLLFFYEWQKRDLPHCHMLFFIHKDDIPKTPEEINHNGEKKLQFIET
jgi:hypothetical protein